MEKETGASHFRTFLSRLARFCSKPSFFASASSPSPLIRDEIERGQRGLEGETRVIRQAISCDICGDGNAAYQPLVRRLRPRGELRVSGWNPRSRLRAGAKHLCGQTCLHKLVDDFMARTLFARGPATPEERATQAKRPENVAIHADTSLTSSAPSAAPQHAVAFAPGSDEFESSAHLIPSMQVVAGGGPSRPPLRLAIAESASADAEVEADAGPAPNYSSRNWRAEAWIARAGAGTTRHWPRRFSLGPTPFDRLVVRSV